MVRERIIYIKTEEYNIDKAMKERGKFNQSRLRGIGLARCEVDDLVHILTTPDYKMRYTCIVSDVNDTTEEATLEKYDEYKSGIPLSFLEENGCVNKRAHKNWDFVDGLYDIIRHKG